MDVKFDCLYIRTAVADSPGIITSFMDELRHKLLHDRCPLVSVDINPTASTSNLPNKTAATLQLCYKHQCIIIQLLHLDVIPQALKTFLVDPKIPFVSCNLEGFTSDLERSYGIKINCTDGNVGLGSDGKDLAHRYSSGSGFNVTVPESAGISAWGARNLTREQIKHAAVCAFAIAVWYGLTTAKNLKKFLRV